MRIVVSIGETEVNSKPTQLRYRATTNYFLQAFHLLCVQPTFPIVNSETMLPEIEVIKIIYMALLMNHMDEKLKNMLTQLVRAPLVVLSSAQTLSVMRSYPVDDSLLQSYSSLTISCVAISALSSCSSTREVVLLSGGAPSSPPDTSIALSARISSSQTRRRSQHIPPAC